MGLTGDFQRTDLWYENLFSALTLSREPLHLMRGKPRSIHLGRGFFVCQSRNYES
jgi:hypothetical protein